LTYPTNLVIAQGTLETTLNTTNWNIFVDQINAIAADLVAVRTEIETFSGVDHTAAQATDVTTALGSIRHMLTEISGETNWYDDPAGSLKIHNHSVGQGGLIPWGVLGISNSRKIELHPQYRGAVLTKSLRGASASGNNTITINTDVDVVSYMGRHYYEGISSQASLQDYYAALRFTLPTDFGSWATSNAIQIEYRTGSALSSDCHVDVYIYKSGNGTAITNSDNNVNVNWSNIGISGSNLGTWSPSEILEIYLKLESKNNNYARIGKVALNYTS